MYEVTVKIGGNASKYWASLEFDDAKGKTHRKEIARERSATKSSNTLQEPMRFNNLYRRRCPGSSLVERMGQHLAAA